MMHKYSCKMNSLTPFHTRRGKFRLLHLCCLLLSSIAAWGQNAQLRYDPSGSLISIGVPSGTVPVLSGPQNTLAAVGGSAALTVSANSSPPLTYQWFFNSNVVSGATMGSLLITNISLTNFGFYHVVVGNASGSTTSVVARLELDADGDGLSDSWEITYFGSITNQSGAFDRDNDGVSNLAEFREGSNPTNATSLFPRLTVQAYRCTVAISPLLEKYTNGQVVLLTATPDTGQSFILWTGATNSTSLVVAVTMTTNKSVTAQAGLPLANSLDITNGVITGGDVAWFGQSTDTKDGIDAVRSGRIGHNQVSWTQITNSMAGEGTVSFWWKVASQDNSDYLRFLINGTQKPGQVAGSTNWYQKTYYLTSGVQTVRFEYIKNQNDGSQSDGIQLNSQGGTNAYATGPYPGVAPADAGWIDQLVFEVYADPLRDTDADGMADLWEYRYFYSLDQTAVADPDNDGISNLDEYLEGTDPTSSISLKPRLTLLSEGAGAVSVNPNKPKYNYSETITNSAVPAASNFFVMWTGAVFNTNTSFTMNITANRTIKGIFGFALDQALETSGLTWTRGGFAGWYGQTNVSHDGTDTARSAPVNFGQESWMETAVNGPGSLTFWWKVSSLTNQNTIRLNLNGVEQSYRISGEVDWQQQSFYLGAGTNTFRWRFVRNNYDPLIDNVGWVDQVVFTPGNIAPNILSQPTNITVLQGSNVTLTASAVGTPSLMYEWLRNGTNISVASTNASYTLTNISPAQSGSGYAVRVSNSGGTTSGVPFSITVLPVPPVNDNFSNRLSISGLTNTASGYNLGATRETGEPSHAGFGGSRSVWWTWVAPRSGSFRLHASSQGISSLLLGVYTGGAVNALTTIASDQSYGTFSNSLYYSESEVVFNAVSNTVYGIAVDTGSGDAGWIQLALTYIPPPANDQFANRTLLLGSNVVASGYNIGATAQPGEPDHSGFGAGASNSVWWAWTAPRNGIARLNSLGTTYSPVIGIYSGSSVSALTQIASGVFVTQIDFAVTNGVSYAIAFDGLSGNTGNIQFSLGMLNPVISSPAFVSGGGVQILFSGLPNAICVLHASTNLTVWSPVSTNTLPPSGTMTLSNFPPLNDRTRFYRIELR
jgi:hypothetical protein